MMHWRAADRIKQTRRRAVVQQVAAPAFGHARHQMTGRPDVGHHVDVQMRCQSLVRHFPPPPPHAARDQDARVRAEQINRTMSFSTGIDHIRDLLLYANISHRMLRHRFHRQPPLRASSLLRSTQTDFLGPFRSKADGHRLADAVAAPVMTMIFILEFHMLPLTSNMFDPHKRSVPDGHVAALHPNARNTASPAKSSASPRRRRA